MTVFTAIIHQSLHLVCHIGSIYQCLKNFIDENKEKIDNDRIHSDEIDIRDYLDDYCDGEDDGYKIHIDSLFGLRDFSKFVTKITCMC